MLGIFIVLGLGFTLASVVTVLTLFTLMLETSPRQQVDEAPNSELPPTLRVVPRPQSREPVQLYRVVLAA